MVLERVGQGGKRGLEPCILATRLGLRYSAPKDARLVGRLKGRTLYFVWGPLIILT
jgi:hypothetical protein